MFSWSKLGKIFDPVEFRNDDWLFEFAQAPASVIFDDRVRFYFSCRPPPDKENNYVSYSAWVDVNRENLFEILEISSTPVLSLGSLGEFDEFGTYPISVIKDGDVFLAYYAGWTRCASVPFNVAIGMARSFDGNSFEKVFRGPVLGFCPDEPFVISGPKIRRFGDKFYLFYIAGTKWKLVNDRPEPVYRIRMASSNDGVRWTRAGIDLIPPRIESDEAQASPDVFFDGNKYHMFFCYRYSSGFRGKERGYRIGYAWSQNLNEWHRDDEKAGLTISECGWDSQMVSYPHIFELDGKIFMAYLGNDVGREGFGLAELIGGLD